MCSSSIDSVGKKCHERKEYFYQYKETINILPSTSIDAIAGVAKCGEDSVRLNLFLASQIKGKKLKFNERNYSSKGKCFRMHVGKKGKNECWKLKVHENEIVDVDEIIYLGDILSNDSRNTIDVKFRASKGIGLDSDLMDILENVTPENINSYKWNIVQYRGLA